MNPYDRWQLQPDSIILITTEELEEIRASMRAERDCLNDAQDIYKAEHFGLENDRFRYLQACVNIAIHTINCELQNRRV